MSARNRQRLRAFPVLLWAGMLAAALVIGCGSSNPYPAGSFERGQRYWENGDLTRAVEALGTFVRQNPTDSLAAEAQYLKALAYMETWIYDVPDHAAYLDLVGRDHLETLRLGKGV